MMYYIYKIENLKNHLVYVGLTNNPERRKARHFTDLARNRHDNSFLQKDYIKTEVRALLEEEFDLISGRAKQMLDLRYKKDYTYQQIADELGISIGNVKNILNKIRTRITKKVNKNESNLSKGVENCKAVT